MRLSFIIPVYNAENFIVRCVYSIVNQPFDNVQYEILLVNDGSSDSSDTLCRQLEQENPQVKYFSKENRGPGHSRNYGLDRAQGDYIWFIDADDYLEPEIMGLIKPEISKNYDLYLMGYQSVDVEGNVRSRRQFPNMSLTPEECLKRELYINLVWCKIIKKDIIAKNNLRFREDIRGPEDFHFSFRLLSFLKNIASMDLIVYNYVENPGSLMNTRSVQHMKSLSEDSLKVLEDMTEFLENSGFGTQKNKLFEKWLYNYTYGYLLSLFRYNYPLNYVRIVLNKLQHLGIYPIKLRSGNWKRNLFITFSNQKPLYLLALKLKRIKL